MLFSQDIGIDLGTSNTLVFVKGKGRIIREPSVVAVDQRFTPVKVVAVGSEAKDMIGRTPGSIVALRLCVTALLPTLTQRPRCLKNSFAKLSRLLPSAKREL